MKSTTPILLIDDDIVDAMSVKRALRELAISNPLHVIHHGDQAIEHLRAAGSALPGVILLDLNMPRMNGIEFMQQIRADPQLRRIPVVILTTSREERDRSESFNLGVAGYMVKPIGHEPLVGVMRTIINYWTLSETGL